MSDQKVIILTITTRKETSNEVAEYQGPDASAVAQFVTDRVVGVETDDGYEITSVTVSVLPDPGARP